jgi:hypothetical protein
MRPAILSVEIGAYCRAGRAPLCVRSARIIIEVFQRGDAMGAKQLTFDTDARDRMLKGVNTLADAVRVTLGPGAAL